MKRRVAIITARGGSKRIPKKNIRDFLGKPIIAYSIQAAIESKMFDEVMVSTDSEEIANIAKEYGANIPFMRSEKTSDDFATTADVLLEVLAEYKKIGQEFDEMVCIYPTAPFVTAEKLIQAINKLESNGYNEVMSVVQFSFPPQRGYVQKDGLLELVQPEHRNTRSQDLEKIYHDAGQFYCFDVDMFLKNNGLVKDEVGFLLLDEMEVQDIDNLTDWKLAEIKYNFLKQC